MRDITPGDLITKGEEVYFNKREELEKTNLGHFAVIETNTKKIFVDEDKYTAIQKAQAKYPHKLFYIVQIGNLMRRATPEINEAKGYGWAF
ncbi:hypothetical protein KJ953_00700 [Patescibacteria group bacterium]|nr:hypothetical protein [Patescibacteria group bacterium]